MLTTKTSAYLFIGTLMAKMQREQIYAVTQSRIVSTNVAVNAVAVLVISRRSSIDTSLWLTAFLVRFSTWSCISSGQRLFQIWPSAQSGSCCVRDPDWANLKENLLRIIRSHRSYRLTRGTWLGGRWHFNVAELFMAFLVSIVYLQAPVKVFSWVALCC